MPMMRAKLVPTVLSGPGEINTVCPAITPTLGAERAVNGGFATDSDWNKGVGWSINTGTGKAENAAAANSIYQTQVAAGNWCQQTFDIDAISANGLSPHDGSTVVNPMATTTGAGKLWTYLTKGTGLPAVYVRGGANNATIDNVSLKYITFASMLASLGNAPAKSGTYQCTPTRVNGTQAGLVFEYKDANNFCLMHVDSAQARLYKVIDGTWTSVVAANITYGDAKALKCIVDGTTHTLFYDGSQVGTPQTIDNSGMGLGVYGFSSYASNSVGTVTTNRNLS